VPEFAHIPLLRNKDRSKMSKRKNPVSIFWYRDSGYLPEALMNFMCLLGWSHPEGKEIFDLDEFTKKFTLERVKTTGPIFDMEKLDWINKEYIKNMEVPVLAAKIYDFYKGKYDKDIVDKITPLVKERISTLAEFKNLAGFFFERPEIIVSQFSDNDKKHVESAISALEKIQDWSLENVNASLMEEIKTNDYHVGKFFMSLRLAITGQKVTPPINDSIVLLGQDEILARLGNIRPNSKKAKA